ncbi:hypothetical protein JOF41_001272 [Saccharothrix coeruleofusca]|uniref:hypothetical protein n=1 Tax=Saccharothrix coeruleofusca TaxID=33919 RepID=UPI001AEA850C|nr:hypothetical protein [Saccharothrix coeruleofusca]MBP2335094.1 hypothetical protein [Saccharothrix coeruleofusca]
MGGRGKSLIAGGLFLVAAVAAWSLVVAVAEEEAPVDPAELLEGVALTGFRRVAVVHQTLSADLVSYGVYVGPRSGSGPRARLSDGSEPREGATVPDEWQGLLEGVANSNLGNRCTTDVLRFLPDRLPEANLTRWGVEETDVADARAGRSDIAYVRIACSREQR